LTLIATGVVNVPPGSLLLEDARDLWVWGVAAGRAVPPKKWVDDLAAGSQLESFANVM
jgi:hypothetical protein